MEYTRAKPWPFFMYKSLIAVNCSYTRGKKDGEAMSADIQLPTFTFFLFLLFCSLHQFDDYIAYL